MAATFPLEIVTPEKTIVSEEAVALKVPASSGSMGILAGHAPLLADLGVGECVVRLPSGAEEVLAIAGGFLEVSRERVTVLADSAEMASEIDVNRAEATLAQAREMLANLSAGTDVEAANRTIRHAQTQIRIARGGSHA